MKPIYLYALLITSLCIPGTVLGYTHLDTRVTDTKKEITEQQREGEENGDEPDGQSRQDKKKQKVKEDQEKARKKQTEEGSMGMLKELFQNTFDYFYAPDSTKSKEIGQK